MQFPQQPPFCTPFLSFPPPPSALFLPPQILANEMSSIAQSFVRIPTPVRVATINANDLFGAKQQLILFGAAGRASLPPSSETKTSTQALSPRAAPTTATSLKLSKNRINSTKINSHAGKVTKYKCPHCGRCLANNSCLIRHVRVHTGEKPFVCSVCGIRFRQKGTMDTHMRIHTKEAPFSCHICGASFRQHGSVSRHVRRCAESAASGFVSKKLKRPAKAEAPQSKRIRC